LAEDRGVRDTELYRQILGLESPWYVARVELAMNEQRVDVWLSTRPRADGNVLSAGANCTFTSAA
jgi:hypothetical protein